MYQSSPISKREREILMLIAQEFSSKEIADKLFLSTHTVISHRKNIMQKFRVRNGAGLVREGFQRGLLKIKIKSHLNI